MGEWIDFERWPECVERERPGYVYEVVNAEEQRMLTQCTVPLPLPFDWQSGPVRFRLVPETKPRHSEPLPAPVKRK